MPPRVYALDTNAVIYYITDEAVACGKLVPIIQDPDTRLIVPAIVVAELWAAPHAPIEHMDAVRDFLGTTTVVPLNEALAQSAGVLRRMHKMTLGDACIAATALAHGVVLLTRDDDFKKVEGLRVESI